MKIEGKISILINGEYTTIEVMDGISNVTFLKIKMSPEQLSQALSRCMRVECDATVHRLELVGKQYESKKFEFEIDGDYASNKNAEQLRIHAQMLLTDGWIADGHFGSRDSFFKDGDKQMARCTIRRWVNS